MAYPKLTRVVKKYTDKTIRARLENFLLDNVGVIVTNEHLKEVAKDPVTGQEPENWHQRLSELRTDHGYTILSQRDNAELKTGEYCLVSATKRELAKSRVAADKKIKAALLATQAICAYAGCGLKEGDIDPIGGGTVRLQLDHKTAHDHDDRGADVLENYQLLCGRHNVTKKNLWDDNTGKLNVRAIIQAFSAGEKRQALKWLMDYFGLN